MLLLATACASLLVRASAADVPLANGSVGCLDRGDMMVPDAQAGLLLIQFNLEMVVAAKDQGSHESDRSLLNARPSPGRHIQYMFGKEGHFKRGGLNDRLRIYRWLVELGAFHHAMVHIPGGATNVKAQLVGKHTRDVADSWGHYFDISANGGNPWYDIDEKLDCTLLEGTGHFRADWKHLFDDGSTCVNVNANWHHFPKEDQDMFGEHVTMPVSKDVVDMANGVFNQMKKSHGSNDEFKFGFYHVRRCDREKHRNDRNVNTATDTESTCAEIAKYPDLHVWYISTYAEADYDQQLRACLKPLSLEVFFEEDVMEFDRDNYFTYMVSGHLSTLATVSIDTRKGVPSEVDNAAWGFIFPRSRPGDEDGEDINGSAICGGRKWR